MSDGLVRKADVIKVIGAYCTARLKQCDTADEAAKEIIHKIDLTQLIKDMKEVDMFDYDLSGFCDKLWESAYQKGYEDGRGEFDCEGCKHINLPLDNYPCNDCSRYYIDRYDNKKGDTNG